MKCKVHSCVCNHVIRCTENVLPRLIILEALTLTKLEAKEVYTIKFVIFERHLARSRAATGKAKTFSVA